MKWREFSLVVEFIEEGPCMEIRWIIPPRVGPITADDFLREVHRTVAPLVEAVELKGSGHQRMAAWQASPPRPLPIMTCHLSENNIEKWSLLD